MHKQQFAIGPCSKKNWLKTVLAFTDGLLPVKTVALREQSEVLGRLRARTGPAGLLPMTLSASAVQSQIDTWQKTFITLASLHAWAAYRAARRPRGGVTPPIPRWSARGNSGRRSCRWQR